MRVAISILGVVVGVGSAMGCGGLLAPEDSDRGPGATTASGDAGTPSVEAIDSGVDAILPTGLTDPRSLTVVGNQLFWIQQNEDGSGNGSIMSVGVGGGTPSAVVSLPNLDLNLTSDGISLYFTSTASSPLGQSQSTLWRCDLAGTHLATVAQDVGTDFGWPGPDSQIFLVDGVLDVLASQISGGELLLASISQAGVATFPPMPGPSGGTVMSLYWADQTGYYVSVSDGTGGVVFWNAGHELFHPSADQNARDYSLAVVNGEAYLMTIGGAATSTGTAGGPAATTAIWEAPATTAGNGGGATTVVASLPNWSSTGLAADAKGMYVTQAVTTNAPGIYSVSVTTGATTLLKDDPSGSAYDLTLAPTTLYWFEYTDDGHVGANLHAKSR